jgi:serine/threonine-protein kinase
MKAAEDSYTSPEAQPGAIIDEKYCVEGVIGRGGVGLVVVAMHLQLGQRVAIKMIRDDVPMQRELLERFLREARAASMIRSEHVARVLDVGRLATGRPYIVMEYLEGEDLDQVVARGPLPYILAVDLTLQACEALAEAHRSGIIHRDLKPANLFLARRPDGAPLVKLLDFGISKIQPLTAQRSGRSVETTSIMGSPGYMAPEQMKSTRDVDARADVWSLGAVLYEMVAGVPAFGGANMIEILNAIAACNPVPASERKPGVPRELDKIIGRCLTTDPAGRFQTIAELAVALRPYASAVGSGLADRVLRVFEGPFEPLPEPTFAAFRSEPRPSALTVITPVRQTSRLKLVGVAVGIGCACGAVVGVLALRPPPSAPVVDSFSNGAPVTDLEATVAASPRMPLVVSPSPSPSASAPGAWAEISAALPLHPPPPAESAAAAETAPPQARSTPRAVVARPGRHHPAEAPSPESPFGDRK